MHEFFATSCPNVSSILAELRSSTQKSSQVFEMLFVLRKVSKTVFLASPDFNVPQIAVEKTLGHSGREIKKKPKPLH